MSNSLKERYAISKSKNIGDRINCPCCGKGVVKKTKQQVFCGGRGDTKCKDRYWNTVTPHKRNNTTRISPASAAWMLAQKQKREDHYMFDDDPGWDAHKNR